MSDTDFVVVIPARHASTRFPGKALALLAGKPLIQHVYERARTSAAAQVVIATDDQRIADAARAFGADVRMTAAAHQSGSDRVAEVAEESGWHDDQIIINVQGDVPLIPPAQIDRLAVLLSRYPSAGVATLCTPIHSLPEYHDANIVKVIMDRSGRALYFSRAAIPALASGSEADISSDGVYRHIGLYAYRTSSLRALAREQPCYLEVFEKLEQLRALWLGFEIRIEIIEQELGPDVDTPEDLVAAERFLARHEK